MKLSRRGFFGLAAGALAARALPEPLLALAAPEVMFDLPSLGLQCRQVNAYNGSFAGIDRSVYPGRYKTPPIRYAPPRRTA